MLFRISIATSLLLMAFATSASAGTIYCCIDARGYRTCGDTLPQICYGRSYTEIVNGIPHVVPPTPTPEQRAERAAEAKAQQEAHRAALSEQRRNQALLDSYSSVADIDYMRDRSLAGLEREVKQGQEHVVTLEKRKAALDKQAAAYGRKPVPGELSGKIQTVADELLDQQRVMQTKRQEIDQIRAKFAAEKKRYLELTGQTGGGAQPGAGLRR
jgi:Domain of unknown function (DUF4124)